MITKILEFKEPDQLIDVHAGTFVYTQPDGEEVRAEFYVRCCPADEDDPEITENRVDAYNQQFTDQWWSLQQQRCINIQYIAILPNPFF